MGIGLYFSALTRAIPTQAKTRALVKNDLRSVGLRIGWKGLVTASRRMPPAQYRGLLKLLNAVKEAVNMNFALKLPGLSVILGEEGNPPIDFEQLAAPEHVKKIVHQFYDFRSSTLNLQLLSGYIYEINNPVQ